MTCHNSESYDQGSARFLLSEQDHLSTIYLFTIHLFTIYLSTCRRLLVMIVSSIVQKNKAVPKLIKSNPLDVV